MTFTVADFDKQRKDRIGDMIGDYLNDDDFSARQSYEEIISEVDSWVQYHKKQYDKAVELKSLMLGHRPIDLDDYRKREDDKRAYEELQDLWYRTDAELAEYKDHYHKVVNQLMKEDVNDNVSL